MRTAIGRFLPVLLLAGATLSHAAPDPVRATLSASDTEAVVEMKIEVGWHVNAHQPRDQFLIPTTVTFSPPPGRTVGDVKYPEPVERTLAFSPGKALLLYEGTVRLAAPLGGKGEGGAPLRATLRYQACSDATCLPPRSLELAGAYRKRAIAALPIELSKLWRQALDPFR